MQARTITNALGVAAVAAVTAFSATPSALASSANDFPNANVVSVAQQYRTGAYGGQCYVFVSNVLFKASGGRIRLEGAHTYYGAYARLGGRLQTVASAQPGDIIQIYDPANDDAYYDGMHDAIITANRGGGNFNVIDSNWGYTEQVNHHELNPWNLIAGRRWLRVAIWRMGQTAAIKPATPGAPSVSSLQSSSGLPIQLRTTSSRPTLPQTGTQGSPQVHHVYGLPSGQTLLVRTGPGTSFPYVARLANGTAVTVTCQADGSEVANTTAIWDRVGPGEWVTDYYIDTTGVGVFTPGLPICG
jgi:hypothetical protein